jgi:hypothetical protein
MYLAAFLWAAAENAYAATKKATEPSPVVEVKPAKQQDKQGENPSIRPAAAERQRGAVQKPAQPAMTELKQTNPKSVRQMKVHRKSAPKAVVQPRIDLMYHGMLETPQRYDPRRNHLGMGVLDPYNPELTHDHFQELDRNQDGKIDPVERALGRLDMDRDLSTHQRR